MTEERLFYKGGRALSIGAVLEVIGFGLYLVTLTVPVIPGLVSASLLILAEVLTVYGIFAWYGSQMAEMGTLGFRGFVVATTGLLLAIAGFFMPYVWLVYLVGVAVLGIANSRAHRYPTGDVWVWLAGSLVALSGSVLGIHAVTGLGNALSCLGRFRLGKSIVAQFVRDSR
jgi:hypothetical protein